MADSTRTKLPELDDAAIAKLGLPPHVERALKANLAVLKVLNREIDAIKAVIIKEARLRREFKTLSSIPGIGKVLAATIMLETGTVRRFAEVGNFSSYCRCVDTKRVSNGKKKGAGNAKNGNKYLAWAFVEAAAFAIRFCPQAKRFYDRKKAKTMITFVHLANHQRQRAVDDLGEGARPVEEARWRPDSGIEEDARVVDEEKPIPPPGNIRGESVVPLIEGRNKRIMAFYRG